MQQREIRQKKKKELKIMIMRKSNTKVLRVPERDNREKSLEENG